MRSIAAILITSTFLLCGCPKSSNPDDPFESINRFTYRFNTAVDTAVLKPAAIAYKTLLPQFIRSGINNAYDNIGMLPTVANDLLQGKGRYAIKDTWRFIINSSLGIGGLIDVASTFSLPPRNNDMGLTFAKWGNKQSPYVVIPLLGPSTVRDGFGLMFDYTFFTPYPYIKNSAAMWSILGVRYAGLRSQLLDSDPIISQAIDKYAFIRDAYLQHRNYLITGGEATQDSGESLYIEENGGPSQPTADTSEVKSPLTTAQNDRKHT